MSYNLPTRKLVSQADQSMIQRPDVPRSRFQGSWTAKKTFDAGYLVPFLCDEILPGDHMKYDVTAYVRMATPLFPMFDNQRIDTFFFYVPNRIVWDNWQRFMGQQTNPTDTINYQVPQVVSAVGGFLQNTVYDHFGIPVSPQTGVAEIMGVNALPLRAYNLIYNDWFRDENLINAAIVPLGNGPDSVGTYNTLKRAKSHDYFTTALPWPQKFTAPNVPLSGNAPILGIGIGGTYSFPDSNITVMQSDGLITNFPNARQTSVAGSIYVRGQNAGPGAPPAIFADLSSQSVGIAINAFRQAMLVQTLLERDARGGTRYTEIIKNHFGVTSPDSRLQRPEYIGGGATPLTLTPVAQTAPTAGVPVGALGAAGTAAGTHSASYAATEHGFIIGLINVRTELSYQQGLHKMWSRSLRYDYYWPSLAGLGEQAVLRKEIYSTGAFANDSVVFGYQERWQEYRTRYSEITGKFRSYATGTLDPWHLSQRFLTGPVLGQAFVEDTPPMDRVLAAGALAANQQYLADILIRREAVRPIPVYGTPASLMRF